MAISPPLSAWPRIDTSPQLLASTGDSYHDLISIISPSGTFCNSYRGCESNFFKGAYWTPDGTSLLTHSEDNGLRTFILPHNLLHGVDELHLTPHTTNFTPSRVYATAIYPFASLSSPETFVYLCSPRGAPIRLHSLLSPSLIGSYQLVNPHTETHDAPYSLVISPDTPTTFLAGTTNQISIFDLNRPGSAPMTTLRTIPTRRSPATATTMKGIVTALALSSGILVAGTNTRQIGLYAGGGSGEVIGVFTLPGDNNSGAGGGITQLLWSVCGRYLYIAERRSSVVSVYDIRVHGSQIGSFRGRKAETNQRIGVDVATGLNGEVVGGGTDGVVKIWEANHVKEGRNPIECTGSWHAHQDAISSAVVHPSGLVMATCSGSRKTFGLETSYDNSCTNTDKMVWDNSLKIWDISGHRRSLRQLM
ncbi:WD40 repeat-like protein [Wilcoxina mikolae CBS 423.85]|nr:WD40 repeat-like protein [Wilcoxina mikolae CBS 423.85]